MNFYGHFEKKDTLIQAIFNEVNLISLVHFNQRDSRSLTIGKMLNILKEIGKGAKLKNLLARYKSNSNEILKIKVCGNLCSTGTY